MITLLASIAGFISSIIPEILKILKDNNDKKHELDILKHELNILDRQIKNDKLEQMKLFSNLEEIADNKNLYSTYQSGVTWVDALNGSVRPVLAYSFFIMYATVKYIQYKTIKNSSVITEYPEILWSIDDQIIFATIISSYFGQRVFSKLWKHK